MVARPRGVQRDVRIGGVSVETFVPKPCRMVADVVDRAGRPVRGAEVTVGQERAQTDEQGTFALTVAPYAPVKVAVKSAAASAGGELRPLCGAGRVKLVVEGDRLEAVSDTLRWSDLGVERKP